MGWDRVWFLGWAKHEDFPEEAQVLPGWRNPTLSIRASQLRKFREDTCTSKT
jgi:hypothetical protein